MFISRLKFLFFLHGRDKVLVSLELDMYVVQAGLKLSDLPAFAFQAWGSLGFTTQHTLVSYIYF